MAILAECPRCHKKQSIQKKACPCGANLDGEKKSKKVRYHIVYRLPEGKQVWRSLASFKDVDPTSIEDARAVEGKFRTSKKENRLEVFDIKPGVSMTFNDLTKWYLGLDAVKAKKSYKTIAFNLASFNEEFGHCLVSRIKPTELKGYQVRRQKEGYADSYIDDHMVKTKTAIRAAFLDRLIDGEPVRTFNAVKKLVKRNQLTKKLSNARERILTQDEYQSLMLFLPDHIKLAFAMGLYTGMRRGEILNLTWDKVNLESRIIELRESDTKDGEARTIPIGEELYRMLIEHRKPEDYVIQFRGKPIKDIRTAIRNACEEAKIPYGRKVKNGITFHDLRHTFNTMMRRAGVDKNVTMTITGHSTEEMNRHYDTVDTEDMRLAIKQYETMLQNRSLH
jgi:integrase